MRKIVINALALSIIFMLLSYTITYAEDAHEYNKGEELYEECLTALNWTVSFSDDMALKCTYDVEALVITIRGYNIFDTRCLLMYTTLVELQSIDMPVYDKKIGLEPFAYAVAVYSVAIERAIIYEAGTRVLYENHVDI